MQASINHTVILNQRLTRHISRLVLQPASLRSLSYQAGQYITVIHKDNSESPMSIASAPAESGIIELHVSHPPKNNRAHDILRMVDQDGQLELRGPFGGCTIERVRVDLPLIFFVRGTGFAPVKAILEAMTGIQRDQPMHLYWAAAQEDFYLLENIKHWGKAFSDFRFTQLPSRSAEQHKLQHAVMSDYPDLSGYQVYASGPVEMVRLALPAFLQHGLQREHFYSDVV
jgi:CDP-4-dehydro-6-deoxyglucose reductase, E3